MVNQQGILKSRIAKLVSVNAAAGSFVGLINPARGVGGNAAAGQPGPGNAGIEAFEIGNNLLMHGILIYLLFLVKELSQNYLYFLNPRITYA